MHGTATVLVNTTIQEHEHRDMMTRIVGGGPYEDSPYAEEADDGLEDAGDDEGALERPHREHEPLKKEAAPIRDTISATMQKRGERSGAGTSRGSM